MTTSDLNNLRTLTSIEVILPISLVAELDNEVYRSCNNNRHLVVKRALESYLARAKE